MPVKFFTVVRKGGVWWLKDPHGHLMFYPSVQGVGPRHGSRVPGAPSYDGIKASGGSLGKWLERTEKRLKDWGFKGLGAWNDPLWHRTDIRFTESLNIYKSLKWEPRGLKPVFDADWESSVESLVKPQVERMRRARGLIGWFLDNEIPWDTGVLFSYFDGRSPDDPNRKAVIRFLRGRHRGIAALNSAWGTRFSSWKALEKSRRLPVSRDAAHSDMDGFLGVVAKRFFESTCRIVRKHDPGRLILGVRYAGLPHIQVAAGQKGATDVMSMNLYIQEGEFPVKQVYEAHVASGGQPVWVTEFSFHSPYDNRSGARNTCGFGSRVRWQKSRGRGYGKFVGQMAALPFVIGCDWFQWPDESPKGRGDGEDVNFGLVDINDRPYEDLVRAIRRTNRMVDRIHARSGKWKFAASRAPETPALPASWLAVRPVPGAPGAAAAGTPVPGLKFRPSLDPMPAKVPVAARVGWRPDGLWVTMAVRDAKRTVAVERTKSSIEWFWMTDAVEIMVRPGGEDREFFDAKSVKVWAVPDGRARGKPFVGVLRNHRKAFNGASGVAAAQRRIPGGYRMDFRIPAAFLGGPLRPWQELRFNLLVMDCEKVQEVCWSSHQGEWTTQRPLTWGRLVLVP